MSGAALQIEQAGVERLRARLARIENVQFGDLLETIGAAVVSQTQRRIESEKKGPDGQAWPAWSPAYARTRHEGQSLLRSDNHLLESIQHVVVDGRTAVEIGSNRVYAAIQQFGGEEVGIPIPPRSYLGLSPDNLDELEAVVDDWVDALLGGRMSILDLRAAIVDGIAEELPELRTCEAHAGRFDVEELRRVAMRAPAVFVACLGFGRAEEEAHLVVPPLRWVAFVICRDAPATQVAVPEGEPAAAPLPAVKRDVGALAIAEKVALLVAGNRWSIAGSHRPTGIQGDNLYSGTIDKVGVALWAVSWTQGLDLDPTAADAETLFATFEKFHAEFDLAPVDDKVAASDDVAMETEEDES